MIGCGIAVASSDPNQAFKVSGTSTIDATSICVAGGALVSGLVNFLSATPEENCTPPQDTLIGLQSPPEARRPCNFVNFSLATQGNTVTLSPGVYCGGITVSGSDNIVNFLPGNYILAGGGFNISGANTLNGTDLLFYNTDSPGTGFGNVDFSGDSTVNLRASRTGDYAGVLFFQDRSQASADSGVKFKVAGTVTTNIDGTVYFPNNEIEYSFPIRFTPTPTRARMGSNRI